MKLSELDSFLSGYSEGRQVAIALMRKVASIETGHVVALKALIESLENEEAEYHWEAVKNEFPGVSKEQFLLRLEKGEEAIVDNNVKSLSPARVLRLPESDDVT
jgi:hypothetical protein